MTDLELQIGVFGTFDVENYGDLLFPLIVEAELSRRLGPIKLHRFSYHRKSPQNWPYTVTSLTELPEIINNLDGVVIGGGHILRFDKQIAPNYVPPIPSIHHPTGYWLVPILVALQANIPVTWNAPGVHGDIPEWADPLIKLAINGSCYVSVRDEPSRQALACFADDTEIHIVPDSAFGIARLFNTQEASLDFNRLCDSLGLGSPYIIVQEGKDMENFARFMRDHPEMHRNYRVLILEPSPVLNENEDLIDYGLPGILRIPTWPHPLLMAELIGNAAAVVGTSLHLSITALAFSVPLFRRFDTFDGKYATLLKYDGIYPFTYNEGIDPELFVSKLREKTFVPEAHAAMEQLSKHWDTITDIFMDAAKRPAANPYSLPPAVSRFWQSLPGLLETRAELVSAPADAAERKALILSRSVDKM